MLDNELDDLLARVCEQWNIAERRIKKAEHVRGEEVVTPAIFELRYAGRKIVDALSIALREDVSQEGDPRKAVIRYLVDAYEDCVKAKHDAIDAMLSFVAAWFNEVEILIGIENLQKYFPDYVESLGKIYDIQQKITESRGDRHSKRDSVYDGIENDGVQESEYVGILDLYKRMRLSRDRIDRQVRRDRRHKAILTWSAIISPVIAVISIVLYLS